MLTIRDYENSDLKQLKAIHDGSFPFPDLNNPNYLIKLVVDKDDRIVAAGIIRLTTEGILIIDQKELKISKIKHTLALLNKCTEFAKLLSVDECHVFVQDMNIVKLLMKLGFIECPEKYRLVLKF